LSYYDLDDHEFDLTVYVPTRGRPEQALRLQEQFYKTVSLNSRILFILSNDDEKVEQYRDLHYCIRVSPPRRGFVDPVNLGYLRDRREVYSYALGFMGDDHFPRTVGWDQKVVGELKNMGAGLVYGNDKLQEERIPTQIFMTSDIPLELGFFTLPRLQHLYADNFWLDLGKGLGRIKYLSDVVIEHMHPGAGKASHDEGYEFSGSYNLDQQDGREYAKYIANELADDVLRVKAAIRRSI
jgi:hypothetical protein